MAAYWSKHLLEHPSLRSEAMDWLRDEARLLARGPDAYRPLTVTVAQQRAANRTTAQSVLAELAGALIDQGDTAAGLDTLRLAATYGWNPAVFRQVGQIWASLGDTLQALHTYAKTAADPGSSRAFGDSIRAILAPNGSAKQWDSWVRQAREEMRTAVLQTAAPRPLNGPTRLLTRAGEARHLNDLTSGHVTVVAFWSPNCGFAVRDLGPLQRMADQLRRASAEVVAIVDQPFSAALTRMLKEQHAEQLPVFYDYRSDTRRAFVNFGTPDYFVLDESGQIIFAHSKLEEIPRQVAALVPDRSVSAR
jgi:thiol-disulfide isomerase/thioredoxin